MISRMILGMIAVLVIVGLGGCQTLDTSKPLPLPWSKKDKGPPSPDHVMAVWTEAVHHQTGKGSERGFGGRLIFYDNQEKPLKVDGGVTIFVFDDQNQDFDDPAAKYKFIFPAETLDKHYSKSDLGHSYSFWIPLAPANASTHNYSLVARFDGTNGETVLSSLTRKVMVGSGPRVAGKNGTTKSQTNDSQVQPASYSETESPAPTNDRLRTETIELPPSFSRRLQKSGSTESDQPLDAKSSRGQTPTSSIGNGVNDSHRGESPRSHSEPSLSPAPSPSGFQPTASAPRREPIPGGWQSGLPPTPRSGFQNERTVPSQSTSSLSHRAEQWFQGVAENRGSTTAPTSHSPAAGGRGD